MSGQFQKFLTRLYLRLSVFLKILLLIGAGLLFAYGQYQSGAETLAIFLITFVPMLLGHHFRFRIPPEFETLAVIFVCLSLFFGEVLDFYYRYWWWDVLLHAQSSFLLGIMGFLLVYVLNANEKINLDLTPGFISLFACMFSIGIGAIWEIFEYTMDQTFGTNMQKSGLQDTMQDLIVDCIGALTISILGYGYLQTRENDSFLEHWIERFIEANPRLFHKHRGE